MKKALLFMSVFMVSSLSMAADSTWLLCSGPATLYGENHSLVLNVFERRNDTGDGRTTDLMMIFGNNILTGSHETSYNDARAISLKSEDGQAVFTGKVSVIYDANAVGLRGDLKFGSQTSVEVLLKCKRMK